MRHSTFLGSAPVKKEKKISVDELDILRNQKTMQDEMGDISELVDDGWDYFIERTTLAMAMATVASELIDMVVALGDTF